MQGMIGHHAQAVEMVALLDDRTAQRGHADCSRLRIEVSQDDEMKMMRTWLGDRGQPVPDPHAHHEPGALDARHADAGRDGAAAAARRAPSSIACSCRA